MKNKLKRIAQVLLCCFLLIVWSCETEKLVTDEQTPQAKSILSAKTWFDKYESNGINYELFQNLEYNWSEANITKSEDGTETIIVPVIELKEDKEEIWSQKLYLYKLDEGNFKALLFEIYPDKDVLASSQTIDGGDFNGYISSWDLKNGFIKAAQFENNKVVLEGKISILPSINNEQGKMIADPCYYCPDEEEPTGGSSGFPGTPLREVIIKSPSSPPSFPPMTFIPRGPSYGGVINPSEYTNPPRGGGGSSGGSKSNNEEVYPDCASINFIKMAGLPWQEAAVKNIKFDIVIVQSLTPLRTSTETIILPQSVSFQMPTNTIVGNTDITPGTAASVTAKAIDMAMKQTRDYYKAVPATELMVTEFFKKALKNTFELMTPGSRLQINPGKTVTPTEYKSNWFLPGNCN